MCLIDAATMKGSGTKWLYQCVGNSCIMQNRRHSKCKQCEPFFSVLSECMIPESKNNMVRCMSPGRSIGGRRGLKTTVSWFDQLLSGWRYKEQAHLVPQSRPSRVGPYHWDGTFGVCAVVKISLRSCVCIFMDSHKNMPSDNCVVKWRLPR